MSVRTSLAAVAVVVATLFVIGCTQTASPTSPSSSASSVVSLASSVSDVTVGALGIIGPPITPIWAQLNLVTNYLVSANQQLNEFFAIGPPIIPGNPVFPAAQNSLDFYLKANGILDTVAQSGPPITPQTTEALHAILREAHTTLDLLTPCGDGCQIGPPIFLDIATQANHTTVVANGLLTF